MYNPSMRTFALSDANQDLSSLIDRAAEEPILITRQGKEAAVVISPYSLSRDDRSDGRS